MYTNFKYANQFGNRCAIFARPAGVGLKRTEVFILECSKKDPFSRRKAREVYQNYIHLGESFYTKFIHTYRPLSEYSESSRTMVESREKIPCHPQIIELPIQYNNERITRFWQELKNHLTVLELAYQIEK